MADAQIAMDDPGQPDVRALLKRHLRFALAQTPPEHSFALDLDGLLDPAITFFSFRAHGSLLGIGAIKRLSTDHAEIKSMHTCQEARGRGIGRAMLTHLLELARDRGFRRVSLETGTTAAFAPARALYQSAGFMPCLPFADYLPSEDNVFMTLELDAGPALARWQHPGPAAVNAAVTAAVNPAHREVCATATRGTDRTKGIRPWPRKAWSRRPAW